MGVPIGKKAGVQREYLTRVEDTGALRQWEKTLGKTQRTGGGKMATLDTQQNTKLTSWSSEIEKYRF